MIFFCFFYLDQIFFSISNPSPPPPMHALDELFYLPSLIPSPPTPPTAPPLTYEMNATLSLSLIIILVGNLAVFEKK